MNTYSYKANKRRDGLEVSASVEADSEAEAIIAIKKLGFVPTELKPSRVRKVRAPDPAAGRARGLGRFGGVKPAAVTTFTRQLSTLQDAGLPIVQSMQILGNMQRPGPFKAILGQVTEDISNGTALSEGMSRFPVIWDPLYTNLVKAGESAGALDVILRRLAEFREKAQRLKKKVLGALIYPVAVMSIAAGILTFIMVFIIPRFESIFKDMGVRLPVPTLLLIEISRFFASGWWLMAIGAVALVVMLRLFRRTRRGANLIDRTALRLPVLGGIIKKSSVARFTRTLGTLVTSGVGFLDALEITKAATPNIVVQNAISAVRESVKEGETINEPLARCGIFDDIVVNMVKVGEETGELDQMLIKIADTYDEEVDAAVAAMMALLEPALIIVMGGVVGFIVIALFMPLISMITVLSKG